MRDENDYFGFSTFEVNGKVMPMSEYGKYIEKIKKEDVICKKKLKIGDVVKIKKTENIVRIKSVDCDLGELGKVDYEGEKINEPNKGVCYYFYQKDVEEIIKENEEER